MKIKTILLVDKDPNVGEAIAIALAEKGVKIFFASDMKDSRAILANHAHELDLVVSDVEPRGHAVELLSIIKTYRTEPLHMIVLGSLGDLGNNAVALQQPGCKLMRMPLDFRELWTSVASLDGSEQVFKPLAEAEPESVRAVA